MLELARAIIELAGSESEIKFVARTGDDPQRRQPDLSLASRLLGFRPGIALSDGLVETIEWFREHAELPVASGGEHITISLTELERADSEYTSLSA